MRFALVVVALLAVPGPVAAGWLQEGGDAARTGVAQGAGPAWNDVALDVLLPAVTLGYYKIHVPPIVVGDTAYVLIATAYDPLVPTNACSNHVTFGLVAQPLDGSPHSELGSFETTACGWPALASDGERVFVAANDRVAAYSIAQAGWVWDEVNAFEPNADLGPLPDAIPGSEIDWYQRCDAMAVDGPYVVVACFWTSEQAYSVVLFVSAFNATTGARTAGPVVYDDYATSVQEAAVEDAPGVPYEAVPDGGYFEIAGLAVSDGIAIVVTNRHEGYTSADPEARVEARFGRIWAVDLESGQDGWDRRLTFQTYIPGIAQRGDGIPDVAPPMISGGSVYAKAYFLAKANLADGAGWNVAADHRGHPYYHDGDAGSGCALLGEDIVCGFSGRTYRLGPDFTIRWQSELPTGERWAQGGLVAAGGRVFGVTELRPFGFDKPSPVSGSKVVALDARTGEPLWSHTLTEGEWTGRMAVSGDAAVVLQPSGRLTVLGTTAASPVLRADLPGAYPATSSLLTVDLNATGGLGSSWEFKADWGDGTITRWQAESSFQHRYAEGVDRHARFFVRNDAGQSASVPMTFYVGQDDPTMNILNSPFDDRYQETSFFFLGLLLTALVAVFGVYRSGRKRRRLERELRDLEQEHRRLAGDPVGLDTMLTERKARARALFFQKKLEEAHASFLERRVDELRHGLRLGQVEQRLDYLPYGMVKALREMLRDATVTEWERGQFVEALERSRSLTGRQRADVRRLIDGWFRHDSGGT